MSYVSGQPYPISFNLNFPQFMYTGSRIDYYLLQSLIPFWTASQVVSASTLQTKNRGSVYPHILHTVQFDLMSQTANMIYFVFGFIKLTWTHVLIQLIFITPS